MANNITVTISVRDRVSPAMSRMASSTSRQERAFSRMGATATRVFSRMGADIQQVTASGGKLSSISMRPLLAQFGNISKTVRNLNRHTNALTQTVARLAATYLGVMGAKAAIETSDTIVSAKNKIGDYNGEGWNSQQTQESLDKIYGAANRARTSYTDMMSNVGKLMTLASNAFDDNIDNAIRFQEVMSKAYAVSGASQAEQASSMYQMIQALSSGVLQGDELRSVREGATAAYQMIEKYAQEILHSDASLKQLASDGLITSDLVVAAIMNAGDSIDARFEKTRMTAAQMWTRFKNDAIKSFEPVSQKINDLINSESFQQIVEHVSSGLQKAAGVLLVVFNVLQMGVDAVANHWSIFAPIILFFIGLITASLLIWAAKGAWAFLKVGVMVTWCIAKLAAACVWHTILAAHAFMCALAQLSAWAIVLAVIIIVIGAILLIGWAYSQATGTAFNAIGAIVGMFYMAGAIFADVIIIAMNLFIKIVETIVNVVKVAWSMVVQIFVLFAKLVLGAISLVAKGITVIINGIIDAVESVVNFIRDKWNSLVSMIPESVRTKLGIDVASKADLSSWHWEAPTFEGATKWLDNVAANNTYEPFKADYFELLNPLDQYKKGYKVGTDWYNDKKDSVLDKFQDIKDTLTSGIGNVGKTPTTSLNTDDFTGVGGDAIPADDGNAKKTADNTKSTADSLKDLKENFDYLIDLAEREAINRFTTAEIKIEMSNTNHIRENADIDGIISTLSSRLREEMSVVAAGTHY